MGKGKKGQGPLNPWTGKKSRAFKRTKGPGAAKIKGNPQKARKEEAKLIHALAGQKGAQKKSSVARYRGGGVAAVTRAALPKLLRMRTHAGLDMHGGVISGVTEITPDLQLTSTENVAGTVIYQTPIHPLILAPGSRFADIAAMYDQYVFEELNVKIGSDEPYTINGMIGGGLERDPGDPLPAKDGTIDVTKYMEHDHFHAETVANRRGIFFPKDKRAIKKAGKGPTSGFFFNRLPATGNDLSTIFQGQLVIFVHNSLQVNPGTISYPISLGPLTLKWKIRMKEAAEKNNMIGNADYHIYVGSAGGAANPMNWSTSPIKQPTLASWSTLTVPTYYSNATTGYWAVLAPGYYMSILTITYSATGASDWGWASPPAQTDYTGISAGSNPISIKLSQATTTQQTQWFHFKISGPGSNTTPGTFNLMVQTGNSTGWTATQGQMHIIAMPIGENTYLTHRDHKIRSLAWSRLRDGADRKDQLKREVEEVLKEHGLERKEHKGECKYQRAIEERHLELLTLQKPPLKRQKAIEEKKRSQTPEDDADDYEDFESFRFQMRKDPVLRIREEDEKSDRSKPAAKRASSLKS